VSEVRAALVVAVDRYDDPKLRRLQAPAEDAEALRAVLADAEIGGYDVAFALNEREHELRRTLSRFFSERRRDDLLLVHFSCHGLKDEDGDLYFAATDTATDHLHATAIPAELVNRLMDRSASRRIVLMLDCCYGGAFRRGMRSRAGEGVDVKERLNGTGRVVLTASSAMEFAWEGDELRGGRRPSVFTSAVVDGLRTGKADIDGDQQVSVHELYAYVYERIRAETPQQTPLKFGLEEGPLYIARTRTVQPAPLPDDLEAAMRNSLPEVREGAVRGLERLLGDRHAGVALSARAALEGLTDDDSRRVSAAAAAALGGAASPHGATTPAAPTPAAPTPAAPTPAAPTPAAATPAAATPAAVGPAAVGAAAATPAAATPAAATPAAAGPAAATPAARAAGFAAWVANRPTSFWVPAAGLVAAVASVAGSLFWSYRAGDWTAYGGWPARPEYELAVNGTEGERIAAAAFGNALICGALAAVVAVSPWSRWRPSTAVGLGLLLGTLGALLVSSIDFSTERPAYAFGWAVLGLCAGLAAPLPTQSRPAMLAGALTGAATGLLAGLLVAVKADGFAAYAAGNAVLDGLIGVAVVGAIALTASGRRARAHEAARVQ
jgi:hypothetical protein